ncbi:hypothetical protein [Pseudomonas koreensis]
MIIFNQKYSFLATMCQDNSLGAIGFTQYQSGVSPAAAYTGNRLSMATVTNRNIQYLFLYRDDVQSYEIKFLSENGAFYWNVISEIQPEDFNYSFFKAATRREGSLKDDNLYGWSMYWHDPALGKSGPLNNGQLAVPLGELRLGINQPICIRADAGSFISLENKISIGNEWVASARCRSVTNATEPNPLSIRLNVLQLNLPFTN